MSGRPWYFIITLLYNFLVRVFDTSFLDLDLDNFRVRVFDTSFCLSVRKNNTFSQISSPVSNLSGILVFATL